MPNFFGQTEPEKRWPNAKSSEFGAAIKSDEDMTCSDKERSKIEQRLTWRLNF
jgi:hypothetical protein